jgi:DHA1 family bicyclomycin/chloramphenicol resistance-like MFS transporter
MHGVMGKPPQAVSDGGVANAKTMLMLLVVMTGIAPISLYLLVPALPVLATTFGRGISVAQMTVSLYMVGIACSQLIMGPLSDRFGRRPVLLAGLSLMVAASIACSFAENLPQLIAARFLQALGGASGMVVSRAIIRDLYPRERVGAMISLVIAVMMIAQMLSPLTGGLLETAFGWRAIFYAITVASLAIAIAIAFLLPETRGDRTEAGGFRGDVGSLLTSRAFIGYMLCQVLASQIIFAFAGGGPYIVVTQMGRSSAEYGAWFATTGFAYLVGNVFCVRFSPRHSLEKLIWFGLALQVTGSALNLGWSIFGINQVPQWLFGTQMIVMVANAFVMANSAAGAISVRPEAAGTASGAMGFLQQGIGSLVSQFGAYLGGHFTTTLPLTSAIFVLSLACASTMIFIVPRRTLLVSEELIEQAEEEEIGMM